MSYIVADAAGGAFRLLTVDVCDNYEERYSALAQNFNGQVYSARAHPTRQLRRMSNNTKLRRDDSLFKKEVKTRRQEKLTRTYFEWPLPLVL